MGTRSDTERSATEIATITRTANVRLKAEQNRVLGWYLKGVMKFSALVCRYCLPPQAARYIGPTMAQAWTAWDKQALDGRVVFEASPDSQLHLDAAEQARTDLQLYQMVAKDPNVVRVELLKELFSRRGYDPARLVVDKLPEKTPEPNISFRFSGEDLIGPQGPMVRAIMAQAGIDIPQDAVTNAASQLFKQVALGVRDASGKALPPRPRLVEHGGPAEQVRPLTQQTGDETTSDQRLGGLSPA